MEASIPAPYTRGDKLKVIGAVMMCAFLGALDHSILAPALPTIGQEMGAMTGLAWIVTAYLLTSTVGIPIFGKLSDGYGRRRIVRIAVVGFIAGSVLCALAFDLLTLILARSIQGLFGGALMALAQIVIADVITPKERGRYQGYIMAMFAASSFLGPSLGGVLTEFASWRLIFWINVPLGLIALVVVSHVLRRIPSARDRQPIDYWGVAFITAGTVPFLLALSLGNQLGWLSPGLIGLCLLALVFWSLFAFRILHVPAPFIPLEVLAAPVILRVLAATVFAIGVSTALATYLPLYFEIVLGFSASQSGLALIGMSAGTIAGSLVGGNLIAVMDRYRRPALAGLALAALASLMLAWAPQAHSPEIVLGLTTLVGFGVGTFYPLSTISVQNAAPPRLIGTTLGTLNFVRSFGQAMVVTIFGVIVLGSSEAPTMDCLPVNPGCSADLHASFVLVFVVCALSFAAAFLLVLKISEVPLRDSHESLSPP